MPLTEKQPLTEEQLNFIREREEALRNSRAKIDTDRIRSENIERYAQFQRKQTRTAERYRGILFKG